MRQGYENDESSIFDMSFFAVSSSAHILGFLTHEAAANRHRIIVVDIHVGRTLLKGDNITMILHAYVLIRVCTFFFFMYITRSISPPNEVAQK